MNADIDVFTRARLGGKGSPISSSSSRPYFRSVKMTTLFNVKRMLANITAIKTGTALKAAHPQKSFQLSISIGLLRAHDRRHYFTPRAPYPLGSHFGVLQ